jgi:hypothetical protein
LGYPIVFFDHLESRLINVVIFPEDVTHENEISESYTQSIPTQLFSVFIGQYGDEKCGK